MPLSTNNGKQHPSEEVEKDRCESLDADLTDHGADRHATKQQEHISATQQHTRELTPVARRCFITLAQG